MSVIKAYIPPCVLVLTLRAYEPLYNGIFQIRVYQSNIASLFLRIIFMHMVVRI